MERSDAHLLFPPGESYYSDDDGCLLVGPPGDESSDSISNPSSDGAILSDYEIIVEPEVGNVYVSDADLAEATAFGEQYSQMEAAAAAQHKRDALWWEKPIDTIIQESRAAGWKGTIPARGVQFPSFESNDSSGGVYKRLNRLEVQNAWLRRTLLDTRTELNKSLQRIAILESALDDATGNIDNVAEQTVDGVNGAFATLYAILNEKLGVPIPDTPVFYTGSYAP